MVHNTDEVWGDNERIAVEVIIGMEEVNCPYCGSPRLYGHGLYNPRKASHSWGNDKKVYLEPSSQRWRCQECCRCFNGGAELLRPYPG